MPAGTPWGSSRRLVPSRTSSFTSSRSRTQQRGSRHLGTEVAGRQPPALGQPSVPYKKFRHVRQHVIRHAFCAPDSHTFPRNRARSGDKDQNAPKAMPEIQRFTKLRSGRPAQSPRTSVGTKPHSCAARATEICVRHGLGRKRNLTAIGHVSHTVPGGSGITVRS